MAKKSSGKRSSNRVGQRASAEAKLSAALQLAYSMKPGDKVKLVFGRVEKELGFSQFLIVTGKNRTVHATPLGVFTKKSCPISAGQIVIMEPVEREGQTHLIIARLDTKKDVKTLTKMGIIPRDILEDGERGTEMDDLFDYGEAHSSDDETETAAETRDWKSRGQVYTKKKQTTASVSAAKPTTDGVTAIKDEIAAVEYADNLVEDVVADVKKPRRRKAAPVPAPSPTEAEPVAPNPISSCSNAEEDGMWGGVTVETFVNREVPTSWEEDDDAVDIDNI